MPGLSRLPVTHYNLSCTSGEGDSCNETLPADATSYNLTVKAGVQYTITVSALSNGRESQDNPWLNFSTLPSGAYVASLPGSLHLGMNLVLCTHCYYMLKFTVYI